MLPEPQEAQVPDKTKIYYKYLNPDYSVNAVLTLDRETKAFVKYETFTPENPYKGQYDDSDSQSPKLEKKHVQYKTEDEFVSKNTANKTKNMYRTLENRWLDDYEYKSFKIKRSKTQNITTSGKYIQKNKSLTNMLKSHIDDCLNMPVIKRIIDMFSSLSILNKFRRP